MRREFLFATVLAAALSMGVSAQSGTGQAGQAGQGGTMAQGAPGGTEKQAKDQNVTVTGCIQNGSQASPATAGTSGSSTAGSASSSSDTMGTAGSASSASRSSADNFVLTNITGAPAALSGNDRVTLSGKDSDLKKHVGHKVQITGKWESNSSSASSSGYGSSSSAAGSSTAGTSGSTGTLKVSSVKMLGESCSQ
jgi:hypothetical protein